MTSAQVFQTVNVTTNSPNSRDYSHPDDHTLPTYDPILFNKTEIRIGGKTIFNSLLMIFWIMVINCLSKEIWFNKNNLLTVLSGRQRHSQI